MAWLTATFDFFAVLISWIRTFAFYAAILVIGPWVLALVADLLLYAFRSVTYEIPIIGGRARGRAPPEPPSISEARGMPVTGKVERAVGGVVGEVASSSGAGGSKDERERDGVRRRVGGGDEVDDG